MKAARELETKILELGRRECRRRSSVNRCRARAAVIDPPSTYWPEIQRICRKKYDVLLVADEVICGFGRTGITGSASHTYGIQLRT